MLRLCEFPHIDRSKDFRSADSPRRSSLERVAEDPVEPVDPQYCVLVDHVEASVDEDRALPVDWTDVAVAPDERAGRRIERANEIRRHVIDGGIGNDRRCA